jgi:hypothetical protein
MNNFERTLAPLPFHAEIPSNDSVGDGLDTFIDTELIASLSCVYEFRFGCIDFR